MNAHQDSNKMWLVKITKDKELKIMQKIKIIIKL